VPSENKNFIVGTCTRTQNASSFVEVKAQSVDGTIIDVSSTSHNLFGNSGEIEVRSARPAIKQGDWVLARPVLDGPPKRQRYVAATGKRLLPFEDLSSLYAPEAARRLLVETGRQDGFVGDKIFRISLSDIIEVRMALSADGRSRISLPEDLTALPVWSFLGGRHVRVPTQSGIIDLFARNSGSSQSGFVNWCSDVAFVRQVIGSFADGGATDDILKRAAEFLAAHSEALERKLSKTELLDPRIGQEIMRARKLAELLKSQDDMLKDFLGVLQGDPEIKKQLDDQIEEFAKATVEAQREVLLRDMTASFEREFEERRRHNEAELNETLRDLETTTLADMEARVSSAEQASLSAIAAKRSDLEEAVAFLNAEYAAVSERAAVEEQRISQAQESLQALDAVLMERKEEVDRLVRIQALIDSSQSRPERRKAFVPRPRHAATPAQGIALEQVPEWVASCELLSPDGKSKFLRVVASICAGGMPVLTGRPTDDFVEVLAALLGDGSFVSFDCDPTVISFDDLWMRPGTGSPTVLGEALEECEDAANIRFCVIRNIDRSAAQVWIKTLSDKLRRREIPPNMLLCLTLADASSPGVEQVLMGLSVFDTSASVNKTSALTALSLRGPKAIERQLGVVDFTGIPQSQTVEAIGKLMMRDVQVHLTDLNWFGRLTAAAKALLKPEEADEFLRAEMDKRSVTDDASQTAKPGLRVIDTGGVSNA
jgi:hypothetical protein